MPPLNLPPIPSYGLPVGVMIPADMEDMLVIEKSISVTNIVNGTTRLQPIVLELGQAAGVVAAQAVRNKCQPSEVSVRDVQRELLDAGAYQVPLLDAAPGTPEFGSYQRVALTGILKYFGRHEGWANQSWLDAGKMMSAKDLFDGVSAFYAEAGRELPGQHFGETEIADVDCLAGICSAVSGNAASEEKARIQDILGEMYGVSFNGDTGLTRGQCAVAIDSLLDPFGAYDVDFHGFIRK